ncbi:MAG: dihydrodipicolinate synthase family protein [Actinomycetota bacterium]|nr:dihydrodipicolinate synthase family protein [Actinomycetota bacterium]
MSEPLHGVFTVLSTPFTSDDAIDHDILKKEIDWLIEAKVDGFVLAMVSEVLRLAAHERRELAQSVIASANGRVPLVTSVGAESTKIATQLAQWAEADGVAAVMATPPSAFAPLSSEVAKYYISIIESVSIPVIMQDASNYVGHPLEISLYVELIDKYGEDRVQFKPEAKPVAQRLQQLKDASGARAKVFEGQGGADLMDTYPIGVVGTMPGAEIPWGLVALWNALESGDIKRAAKIHAPIAKMVAHQTTLDSYVAVEKYLLVKQGIFTSARQRGPVSVILDKTVTASIDSAYADLERVLNR